MTNKKISVIIPSYNSSKTIEKCVLSVINTGYPSLEIIVVDDVSTDDSPIMVEKLVSEYSDIVRLVCHKFNSGPAKARNTGASNATGDYYFFLDSDTEMLPDTLEKFACRIEEADAVTGIYHFEPLNNGWTQHYKALFNYYFFSRKGVIEYEVFDASRAGIKKEVFNALGGFSEKLKWGMDYENEEFGYRLCKHYKNFLDPSIAVRHMFPDLKRLTKTYFFRVALWMEIFLLRRKFESGGVTSTDTGISTAALLFFIVTFPFMWLHFYLGLIPLLFLAVYLYGYIGFFKFTLQKKPLFLPVAIFLNLYFTLILCVAALFGAIKVIAGRSNTSAGLENV